MTRSRVRPFYGWLMVSGLGVTELVSWGVLVYAFSVLVVPMRAELGWSTAELNAAYATGVIVSGFLAIPVGRVLQTHGARGVMTIGTIATVLMLSLWSAVESIPVFFGVFVIGGLAMATTLYEPVFAVTAAPRGVGAYCVRRPRERGVRAAYCRPCQLAGVARRPAGAGRHRRFDRLARTRPHRAASAGRSGPTTRRRQPASQGWTAAGRWT